MTNRSDSDKRPEIDCILHVWGNTTLAKLLAQLKIGWDYAIVNARNR